MIKLIKYVSIDILRNKFVLAYAVILFVISMSVFNLEDNVEKGILSILNVVLILVPLICIIFSTVYIYNSSEFIELLVSQPVRRRTIWLSLFSGLGSSMSLAFLFGIGIPIGLYAFNSTGILLVTGGIILSWVFVSVAMLSSVLVRDKARGVGVAIILWLWFAIVFDGLVLFTLFQFSDYPLEKIMLGLTSSNPIDLCRILILLKLDASAMMGYTGAIFKLYFESLFGMVISAGVLLVWIFIPIYFSVRKFSKKDI